MANLVASKPNVHGTPDSGTGSETVDALDMDGQSIDSGCAHASSQDIDHINPGVSPAVD